MYSLEDEAYFSDRIADLTYALNEVEDKVADLDVLLEEANPDLTLALSICKSIRIYIRSQI